MAASKGTVCVAGSLNIDLTTRVIRHPKPGETVHGNGLTRSPGGKGANQALAAARSGAATAMVGRLGGDANGTAYRDGLVARGVNCDAVRSTPGTASGHALILVDEAGENTVTVIPGANGAVTVDDVTADREVITGADVLILQFEVPMPVVWAAAEMAHRAGVTVVLNPSPFATPTRQLLDIVDVLVVNEHEAATLGDTGVSTVVTSGAAGAKWDGVEVPAPPVEAVDTTGAGDAFAGALAAAIASGASRADALAVATAAGSHACTYLGTQGWTFDD